MRTNFFCSLASVNVCLGLGKKVLSSKTQYSEGLYSSYRDPF